MRKECCFALLIFLVILAISSVVYSRTTNSAYAQTVSLPSSSQEVTPFKKWYDEQKEKQQPSNTVSVKITSPVTGQKVPVGELKVLGTSTDNATTDCQVYVDVNDIKPMQNTTAVGPAGQNDYSNWNFTYTDKYHLISEGINELTTKLSCINNPANITKYYSVNVTGVATSSAAANNTTTVPTSNATTRNETQQRTTMTTMENNETQVSADTANQTQQQTPQVKPKPALQAEHSISSQQPLNQTQNQEEEQEQKQPMTDSQKEGSFTSEEFVPLDESSTGSDIIAEEPKGTIDEDEEKLAELIESVTSDDVYDEEQIEQEKPLEDELLPLERQEVPLETIERQPLEQKQPLETLEDQQPIEEQPVQTFNKEEQPSQSGIQPLEQQPLEEQQPLQTFNRQQLSPTQQQPLEQQPLEEQQPLQTFNRQQLSPTQQQPLEQQPLEEQQPLQTFNRQQLSPTQQQQVPESPAGKQQLEEKRSINQVQEHHDNGHNMPFVLPFDLQDVISAN
jgi:hypothetical protein